MKFLTIFILSLAFASAYAQQNSSQKPKADGSSPADAAIPLQEPRRPKINWGKCPQLEPTDKDIEFKSSILQECLKQNPPPASPSVTQEQVIEHQRSVTECALKIENWFDKKGQYKFDKAEKEIKNKHLSIEMEQALLSSHQQCAQIAKDRSQQVNKMSVVEQVQVYQGCMDAHITQHCQIQIGA